MIEKKRDMLVALLRKNILSGKYGSEGGLPPESELVKETGFARQTVKTALLLLEGEKLITQRGHVYHVNNLPITMTSYVAPANERYAKKEGFAKNVADVENGREIPRYLAECMRVPMARSSAFCVRVTGEVADGEKQPTQLSARYYFLPLTNEQIERMQSDASYDPAWDLSGVLHSVDKVCARASTQEEAKLLELPSGTVILSLVESIRDDNGQLVMVHESALVPRSELEFSYDFLNEPGKSA